MAEPYNKSLPSMFYYSIFFHEFQPLNSGVKSTLKTPGKFIWRVLIKQSYDGFAAINWHRKGEITVAFLSLWLSLILNLINWSHVMFNTDKANLVIILFVFYPLFKCKSNTYVLEEESAV